MKIAIIVYFLISPRQPYARQLARLFLRLLLPPLRHEIRYDMMPIHIRPPFICRRHRRYTRVAPRLIRLRRYTADTSLIARRRHTDYRHDTFIYDYHASRYIILKY